MFVLVGTLFEEILSPIPSFMVLVPAGAVARVRDYTVWYLLILMIFSAIGRIIGSVILYSLARKLEHALLVKKRRRVFSVSHEQIQQLGRRLSKGGWRDWATLFTFNAIPVFPTSGLSLICGFLKVDFRMFAFCSFFGTMINALIFMSIGYAGIRVAETLHTIQLAGQLITGVFLIIALVLLVRYRQSRLRKKAVTR